MTDGRGKPLPRGRYPGEPAHTLAGLDPSGAELDRFAVESTLDRY